MKLEKLSPEQKESLKKKKAEYVAKWLNNDKIDKQKAIEAIRFVYSLIKRPMPTIYKVCNPLQAQLLANKLKGTNKKAYSFGTFLTAYWASFYAFYDTFVDFGIITKEKFPKYFELRKIVDSNIFMTIEFEKAIIIIEKPMICLKNEKGMHSFDGKAIQWADGYGYYYINGRRMPEWIFKKVKDGTITKEDFINEQNEDVRGGIYELIENKGEGSMLDFLGAIEVDSQSIVHANGEIEKMTFYKTKEKFREEVDLNGRSPAELAWLNLECPSTGQRYMLPSDSSFKNCIDAAKFHRPDEVPAELDYTWNSRN